MKRSDIIHFLVLYGYPTPPESIIGLLEKFSKYQNDLINNHIDRHSLNLSNIQRAVEDYYRLPQDITLSQLHKTRRQDVVMARTIGCYLMRKYGHTFQRIGEHYGFANHTSVLNNLAKIEKTLSVDKSLAFEIEMVEKYCLTAPAGSRQHK